MDYKRKKQEPYIRIRDAGFRCILISTGAAHYLAEGGMVDVYEKGSVMAIEAVSRGSYHASRESGRDRILVSSKELSLYISKKLGCREKMNLPVWQGVQEGVAFFGAFHNEREECFLDETWTKVETDYNRRAGGWSYIHDNWIEFNQQVLNGMGERFSAYQSGGVTVLRPDAGGALALTARRQSGKLILVSHALADYLRNQYGAAGQELRLRARTTNAGWVLLGDNEDKLTCVDTAQLEPVELDETELRFLNMNSKKGFYLSAQAWVAMGSYPSVSVYTYGNWLALKPERNGDRKINISRYAKLLHSTTLTAWLERTYPGKVKFYIIQHGSLWLLQPQACLLEEPPQLGKFCRLALDARKSGDEGREDVAQRRALPQPFPSERNRPGAHRERIATGR